MAKAPTKAPAKKPRATAKTADKASPKASPKAQPDRRGTPTGKGIRPGGKGGRIGNPPFVATDDQRLKVEVYAAGGWSRLMIAAELGISDDTLTRHFVEELEAGDARATARIASTVAQQAIAGCRKSQRLWLDRRGGEQWRPKSELGLTGADGGPIRYLSEPPRRDLSGLNEEELEQFERLTAKLETPRDPGDQ
jgi:hypothetical protein